MPERVGKPDLARERQRGRAAGAALAAADGERGPLADAVGGQDRGAARGRGEKGRGRVRGVVAGEEDLAARHAEVRRDDAAHPHLLAERVADRVRERSPRARKGAQRAHQDALELQHAALVEDDRVEIGRRQAGVIEAPLDRLERKAGVVLVARQPLLLHRRGGHAVHHQRRRRVVIVRRDAEDLHVSTGSWAARRRGRRSAPSPRARASRRGAPATRTGGSRTK